MKTKCQFSLSTSWNSAKWKNGIDLVNEIRAIGFDTIELNFALTKQVVDDVISLKDSSLIKVSSLHNICPLPEEVEPDEASPDYYSLASPDEEERALAVEAAKNTIRYAKRLDAKAVVIHAGRVQIKDRTRELASLDRRATEFDSLKSQMIKERGQKKDGYLGNVIRSLEELVPYAKGLGISLGIENRYYYREIPLMDELSEIFSRFKAGDIFYWHDVGHAEVFERLGLYRHKELLDAFAGRLLGVHLHDISGIMNDHRAPGNGTFDFSVIKPFLREDTIKVIEAHPPATADEIHKSVAYLEKALG